MCGISGIYNFKEKPIEQKNIIKKILSIQNFRGPDDNSIWESDCKKVIFGHNRLSIIDLSINARQPFISIDQEYTITFNGEIYNYEEIKTELINNGKRFKSNSDTEVIIEAYKHWDLEFIKKMRGMFAFAIWDNKKKKLILARDPFGIKPLYYSKKDSVFYFASQVKSFLSLDRHNFEKNEHSVLDYYLWGNVREPNTLYKDIFSVPAGNLKILDINCQETNYEYANIKKTILETKSSYFKKKSELDENLAEIIKKTANYHQVSDVPVTFLLSSGIDSNVLLAATDKNKNHKIDAITVDFSEKLKESTLAQIGAKINETDHKIQKVKDNEINQLISKFNKYMDLPTNDGLNNFLVSHFAKKNGSKVLISGIGGDEFFFGYPSFKRIPMMNNISKVIPKNNKIQNLLYKISLKFLKSFKKKSKYAGLFRYSHNPFKSFMLLRCLFTPEEIREFTEGELMNKSIDSYNFESESENNDEFESKELRIMYYEIKYYLCSKLLRDADWASMSNSIELRTPFVDWFFFNELMPILKSNFKVSKKNMLDAFKKNIPSDLYKRKKTGFTIPYKHYYKKISNQSPKFIDPIKDWSLLSYKNYLSNEKN